MSAPTIRQRVEAHAAIQRADRAAFRPVTPWPTDLILRGANLSGADLRGATLSWSSHNLLAHVLWEAADTEPRQMLAAFVGRQVSWCWTQWSGWQHPEREWAVGVLRQWVRPGDGAPDLLRPLVAAEGGAS